MKNAVAIVLVTCRPVSQGIQCFHSGFHSMSVQYRHFACFLLFGFVANCIFVTTSFLWAKETTDENSGLAPPALTVTPLKALLIAGGCCHDYEAQHRIIFEGIQSRANVRVDVIYYPTDPTEPNGVAAGLSMPFYRDPDWAKGYDVVIHDECVALNDDPTTMRNILSAHQSIPAVHLHCAMHSFRGRGGSPKTFTAQHHEAWCRQIGLMSVRHGPHLPVTIRRVDHRHPIVTTLPGWVTDKEELYNNEIMLDAEPLLVGSQTYQKSGKEVTDTAVVAWINNKGPTRTFSTSLGHFNHNVENPHYLDLVTRGLLWACDKLGQPSYEIPYSGSNLVRVGISNIDETAVTQSGALVEVTTSSSQQTPAHPARHGIDGNKTTRWCAATAKMPAWINLEFTKPQSIAAVELEWEFPNQWMQYTIATSVDGQKWNIVFDGSENRTGGIRRDQFGEVKTRFLRVTLSRQERGMWPSLRELRLFDAAGKPLDTSVASTKKILQDDRWATEGNVPPVPHQLSAEEERALLELVEVPTGFEKTLFAPWQMANYPTYIAASPHGDLYVSSDGNGSLGRQPHRGRVLRLRDRDGDGRADDVTEFIRDIDSPRGILWDHDRLYVLHPPHIDVFFDQDGDGVADKSERLISDIAFGFGKRPADHTTNGLEMGIDGWIYVAVGDFGFMKATGSDGRQLQLHGGGVVRFRPDGSGMEIFSEGTRNIYGISVTPTLDLFARDNTNDGGGWNVRFHHLSGLEDHGYPRLFRNFTDEAVPPLADYGGGSGCGACYLDEPGIPEPWNKQVYTCDWGREGSFLHPVRRIGAGFAEKGEPTRFFKMPRPTDIDVDGRGIVYQAAWYGPATFGWKGPEHGFLASAKATGTTPQETPDFAELREGPLLDLLRSTRSHTIRLAAQRMLLRRPSTPEIEDNLIESIGNQSLALENRVAMLYALTQRGLRSQDAPDVLAGVIPVVTAGDPLFPFFIRSCGDLGVLRRPVSGRGPVPTELLNQFLKATGSRAILEAIITTTRQGCVEAAEGIAVHLSSADPLIAHTAFRGLVKLKAVEATLAAFDNGSSITQKNAAKALSRMHQPAVVTALLERLETSVAVDQRGLIIETLARLAQREAPWRGDSWSTRPDTRGPYYQPVTWEETTRILDALNYLFNAPRTRAEDKAKVAAAFGRNRIRNDAGLTRLIELAAKDKVLRPSLMTQLIQQFHDNDKLPAKATAIVTATARSTDSSPATLVNTVHLLINSSHPDAFPALVDALVNLQRNPNARRECDQARTIFLASATLPNHADELASRLVEDASRPASEWYAAGLLKIASSPKNGPEQRAKSQRAIDQAWQHQAGRKALLQAAFWTKLPAINDRILAATSDPDRAIARLAKSTASRLGIQQPGEDTTRKVDGLPFIDVIKTVSQYENGNVALGEAVFTRRQCATCHTVDQTSPAKGPYLGSIAKIYRRHQLAEAILMPNKTIAQGFKTNLLLLDTGITLTGFITNESSDSLTLRDAAGKEHRIKTASIDERMTLPTSVMPAGLLKQVSIHEFASLLDYIESLSDLSEQTASP